MIRLTEAGPEPRPDRAATQLLYDDENARIVSFSLLSGQRVAPHRSPSTVIVQVLEGEGVFRGEGSEDRLGAGSTVVYEPGEMHSMDATAGPLRFLAIIAPRPR
jgi:quercetin dioxygenase-like cupin family protein